MPDAETSVAEITVREEGSMRTLVWTIPPSAAGTPAAGKVRLPDDATEIDGACADEAGGNDCTLIFSDAFAAAVAKREGAPVTLTVRWRQPETFSPWPFVVGGFGALLLLAACLLAWMKRAEKGKSRGGIEIAA